MYRMQPPVYKTYFMDLPLSRLHVLEVGEGEPLIMVPATISELENWRTLAQFMAQWFHVYFFELPGHGQSEPLQDGFSSQKVARLVAQLADELGYERFNLMGFSVCLENLSFNIAIVFCYVELNGWYGKDVLFIKTIFPA